MRDRDFFGWFPLVTGLFLMTFVGILPIQNSYSSIVEPRDAAPELADYLSDIAETVIDAYTHHPFKIVAVDSGWALDIQVHYHYLDRERVLGREQKRANNLRVLLSELGIGLQNLGRTQEDLENRKYVFVRFMQVYVDPVPVGTVRAAIAKDEVQRNLNSLIQKILKGFARHSTSLYIDPAPRLLKYIVEYTGPVESKLLGPGGVRAMALKETLNEVSLGYANRANWHNHINREIVVARLVPIVRFRRYTPGHKGW